MLRPRTPSRILAVAAATALVVLLLPGVGTAAEHDVEVVDSAYEPASTTVTVGDTVTWTHTGSFPHTVTADDGSFESNPDCSGGTDCMANGDTFEVTFDEPGEYPYYCRLHGAPGGGGMSGVIVVEAAAQASPSPTPTATEVTVTGSLTVSDQEGDGRRVTVDAATISGSDGFVVVHADEDGGPGPVIGHAPVEEGTTTGVAVPLDTALTEDQTVWPMLHVDAGEAGTYEFPGPDGPVSADGSVVVRPLSYVVTAADPTDDAGADDELAATGLGDPWWLLVAALGFLVAGAGAMRFTVRRR